MPYQDYHLHVVQSVNELTPEAWNSCAGSENPFVSHAFFKALEESGSATAKTGWQPHHLLAQDNSGHCIGILPGYLKSHSYGEYVFDQSWADAFERAGGRYYPKLQHAVPFTPVAGPRLLLANQNAASALISYTMYEITQKRLSSAHATFIAPEQIDIFKQAGWLLRYAQQFHWRNRGYKFFDDFLNSLSSRKRKAIRKEREQANSTGLIIETLTGTDIQEHHWDAMWDFYQDTGSRKWGRPYLTRSFFSLIGQTMADRLLLILAKRKDRYIAGALNFIGHDTLYGRYWGCLEDHPCLHFELCYYRAIEFALERGLSTVEAGAQGAHKIARGYEPTPTFSAHWIDHPAFRTAIAHYLEQERTAVAQEIAILSESVPFRKSKEPTL